MIRSRIIPVVLGVTLLAACEKPGQSIHESGDADTEININLKPGSRVTVHHPSDVPPVTLWAEDDAIFVEHNLGPDGLPNRLSGNTVKIWLKSQEAGRIWISRNQSPETIRNKAADRSLYEDQNGDGVVDYKRNNEGVFRVAEIVWEKIGEIPDVPPDELNQRLDTYRSLSGGYRHKSQDAEQAGTEQPATRSESKSEGSVKPEPESEGRSR